MILLFVMILTILMIAVMITDFTRFVIPNKLVLVIFAVYPLMLLLIHMRPDWYYDLLIGLAMFMGGFALFALRLMGGGDVKLMAVCAVFVGKTAFLNFVIGIALWGGGLALALLAAREIAPYICLKLGKPAESIPRVFTHKEPAPYGLAIAASFLVLLWSGEIAGLKL